MVWSSFRIRYRDAASVELLPIPIIEPELTIAPTVSTSGIVVRRSITWSVMAAVSESKDPSGIFTSTDTWVLSISGINAVPLEIAPNALTASSTTTVIRTTALCRSDQAIPFPHTPCSRSRILCSFSLVFLSSPADIIGTKVRAINRLASSE